MEGIDYDEALNKYYELKAKYDKAWRKGKKKIKRSNDSMEEKRRKVQNLKKKCVSCRQHGGTIFSSDEQYLKAKCAADKPCKLNIEIKKGIYKYLPTEIEYHRKLLADLKKKIIRIKLDFLFDLEKESETIAKFEKVKKIFESYFEHLNTLEILLQENYNWKRRKNEIELARLQLYTLNEQFKQAIKEFNETDNITLVKDAIGIYIDQILPLQDDVQNNQYATLYIDADDEEKEMKFKLVARGVDIIQKEEIWEAGKVIANIK